ncbi:MAG: hypothetical protein BroJett029_18260 [Alphaproteobacteria bacterium]|nr:MAG: hypothetical protein BroJett029_18260 [Alphaproteobacteria bacterium]
MTQRSIRLSLAVLGSAASLFLSWPFWRDFEYWAEAPGMWLAYFLLGFALAVYVFYVFLGSLRTLFEHDELARALRSDGSNRSAQEDAP